MLIFPHLMMIPNTSRGFKKERKHKAGFTLVELMVAVSVLCVGVVMVLQARLSIISALDSTAKQTTALRLLEQEMYVLEQNEFELGSVDVAGEHKDVMVGSRRGTLTRNVVPVPAPEQEEGAGEQLPGLVEVTLDLRWKEAGKDKKIVLATCFSSNLTKEEEE